MIPKIIHFCWFGGKPKSPLILKCIESWKRYLPDYEIIEWNESNFDVGLYQFATESYESQKYAFTSDVCRLHVLKEYGGVYLDTDVEIIRRFDEELLFENVFIGRESTGKIETAVIGSVQNSDFINDILNIYKNLSFYKEDKGFCMTTNVEIITSFLKEHKGLEINDQIQIIGNYCKVLSREYFDPKNIDTRKLTHLTDKTIAILHYDGSWIENVSKKRKLLNNFIGSNNSTKLIYFYKKLRGEY